MASVKFIAVSRGLKDILDYVQNKEKTLDSLISGINCTPMTAQDEFEVVKKQFRKTDGRTYYHIVQAFSPEDELSFETAHEIGLKFAEYFTGFQAVVVTHMNTEHKHNHIVLNSVNYQTGKKFHQSAKEMAMAKEFSNQLCMAEGLSITEAKASRYDQPQWKKKLKAQIKKALEFSYDKAEFIKIMEIHGYKVKWEDEHKYITFTTPEGYVCRDNKLFDNTLLRKNLELYFEMGGMEYYQNRKQWKEYGDPTPTMDDTICGLISIFDALVSGDNDRFHLETIHHSEEEIELMLRRGKKIEHGIQYVVDDELEQEEEQDYSYYHGFSMGGY